MVIVRDRAIPDEPPAVSDSALLDGLQRGDAAVFEIIFTRYYGAVHRVLHNLLVSHEAAEDLAQETFLVLFKDPPRLADADGLLPWLLRVALNRGYNLIRGERRAREREARAAPDHDVIDPQAVTLQAEERALVRSALARLPERQSQLLLLRHSEFSYAEIAATLEIAPGSVGTLLVRAERAFVAAFASLRSDDHDG